MVAARKHNDLPPPSESDSFKSHLAGNEKLFHALFKESTSAIQLITPDGHVLYSSDSVENVLGYTAEEVQGVDISPYLHPDDAARFNQKWQHLLAHPKSVVSLEYRVKHKDGSWVYVGTTLTNHLATPDIGAIVGNFRNITDQRRINESLRSQTAILRALSENTMLALFMLDEHNYCTFMNPAAESLIGYSFDEVKEMKKTFHDIVHHTRPDGSAYPLSDCPIYQAVIKKHRVHGDEYFSGSDGTFHPVTFTASPILKDGESVGMVVEARDISIERAAEEEYKRLTLVEAQRNELLKLSNAKDEFIALASHQLRTPATAVKQYTAMLLEGFRGKLAIEQRELLLKAYQSNERELTIIDDLLKVAKLDAGKVQIQKENIDIIHMINDVIDGLGSSARFKEISIIQKHKVPKLIVYIDPELFRMVIENLIDNAIKYSPKRSTVTISVATKKNVVHIYVADNGVGIAKEDLKHLFIKFSRIDNPLSVLAGGTGLGLYWVKKIVTLHNAKITAKPNKPNGTIFEIKLPQ
ncbi:MAG: hypothetical protein JWN33_498 [Candidatus Saccharibacteria bacterium]|nr:hypothetical protein [Candidatus Saccharibacteria bacterium]